jgi:hypothetical protein
MTMPISDHAQIEYLLRGCDMQVAQEVLYELTH